MLNITHDQKEDLLLSVDVAVTKNDYEKTVNQVLNDYRKKMDMPGFRKGKVPMGIVKKKYQTAVVVEEVSKMVSEDLNAYFKTQKFELLADPIPTHENINWEGENFNFNFEVALKPTVKIDLKKITNIVKTEIKAEEKDIQAQIDQLTRQYGTMSNQEEISEASTFILTCESVDDTEKELFLSVSEFKNPKQFVGQKVGDEVSFHLETDVEKSDSPKFEGIKTTDKQITGVIKEIRLLKPAALNEAFFKKIYGETCTTETDFKVKTADQITNPYQRQTSIKFINDVTDQLTEKAQITLPASYIDKHIETMIAKEISEGKTPPEEISKEERVAQTHKAFKNQLIVDTIIQDFEIKIDQTKMQEKAQESVKNQFQMYGIPAEGEMLDNMVNQMLNSQEESKRIIDLVLEDEILNVFLENVDFKTEEQTIAEFITSTSKK